MQNLNIPWHEQFADHTATVQQTNGHSLFHIDWNNPNQPDAPRIQFLFQGNTIAVSGTLEEAIYIFEKDVDMQTLSLLTPAELSNFCKASPTGAKFPSWSSKLAEEKTLEILADVTQELGRPVSWQQQDIEAFAHNCYYQHQLFGGLALAIGNSGNQPNPLLLGHWTALQMIHAQLSNATRVAK